MKSSKITSTIDAYNKNSKKYLKKFKNYRIYKEKVAEFHSKYIKEGASILDLGCGPGNTISWILAKDDSCSITGVDLSDKFISIAKERLPQATFLTHDIRSLDIDTKYDVLFSSFSIVHMSNSEAATFIRCVSGWINNGGYLYLSYMNGDSSGFESTSFSKEPLFFNYFTDQFIIENLHENNIEIEEMSKEEYIEPDDSVTIDTFVFAKKKTVT